MAAGEEDTIVIKTDGSLWTWGTNTGDGTTKSSWETKQIS
ncbi:hypothetical protein [Desulfosporosinus metallidurans]